MLQVLLARQIRREGAFLIIATTGTADNNSDFLVFHGPYRDIILRIAEAGYQAVELHILDSSEINRTQLWKELKTTGIRLTSIGTGAIYSAKHYNLVDHSEAIRNAALYHLEQHMITAEPDQALVIVGVVVGRKSDCRSMEEYKLNLEESLYRLDGMAEKHGIKIAFELMNRYGSDFLTTIADGVDYLKTHNFKNVVLHIDTVHMNIEEADIRKAILGGKGYIGHVHVADNDRWYPGHGHYPILETIQALSDIGYDGALVLETNCLPNEKVSAENSLRYLKDILENQIG